ncbi:MAG: acetyl ornithine aminotransferase family protein [Nitrososphaerota archaeon]|nr:acetyl ornithine aminotransferase family protein [Nitrososphaerota archaeon]MDG6930249.1 acetyl ornithine aminotransferase family protein [Nitrososphaerota archaeon]MDG6932627.1 acetyl ornithine aminotransferase family protein [Nitrososphaerota archaeon]MDG6935581.1 acetyl ornithine aminotransferase family protein [Nitrososphaerota archaeon]MDG6944025.1 acetyl ornithine aminotransferase family protein [Nitrososphaerota archaeon]
MTHIKIRVEPPGPKSSKIAGEADEQISPSIKRYYKFVMKSGEGAVVEDADGNRYIDMNAGIAVLALGTSPPEVVRAINSATKKFLHYSYTDFYYEGIVKLARALAAITPGKFKKRVFYGNSGAEAIETALKLSRYHSKRPRFLAFTGAFHGRTMGALSLTASKPAQVDGFSPLVPGVTHVPYPNCYRCPFGKSFPECGYFCVDYIKEQLFEKNVPPDEVAAVFFEPVQGEGGYVVPPRDYFRRLERLVRQYGILLADDEVQSGMGRTGRWFAVEHYGVEPDILMIAKALASGMPLSATVSREDLNDWPAGSHATTFGGNPISIEAALATIKSIKRKGLLGNTEKMGKVLLKRLEEIMERHEIVGDVRGLGLMAGAELVTDRKTKRPNPGAAVRVIDYSWKHGVLLITAGASTLRFSPPLIINQEILDEALGVVEDGIREAEKA